PRVSFKNLRLLTSAMTCISNCSNLCSSVLMLENSGSSDEHVGSGVDDFSGRFGTHTTIDLDVDTEVLLLNHFTQLLNLWQNFGDELLTAESRVHAHQQYLVNTSDQVLNTGNGCLWIE